MTWNFGRLGSPVVFSDTHIQYTVIKNNFNYTKYLYYFYFKIYTLYIIFHLMIFHLILLKHLKKMIFSKNREGVIEYVSSFLF